MLSPELSYLVSQEQHKDRLRNLEKKLLLEAIEPIDLQQPTTLPQHRKIVVWLGKQLVKWGSRLESYDTTPASDAV